MQAVPHKSFAALIVCAALCAWPATAGAKTVKLSFSSTVRTTFPAWTASAQIPPLPFVVQPGDVIRGTLEFDPALPLTGLDDVSQPYSMTLSGPGWSLATDAFTGYALDDRRDNHTICDCAFTGPVSPDPVVFLSDLGASLSLPALDDRIEITRYLGFRQLPASYVPGSTDWRWQPAISLVGSTGVLNQDSLLPADVATWNQFSTKQLKIGIVGPIYGQVPGYPDLQVVGQQSFTGTAIISSFVEVPEPAGDLLAVIAMAGCNRPLRMIRKRHVASV